MEENISLFVAITGASVDVARGFLEITTGNFERAIELFYENPDLVSGVGAGVAPAAASTSRTSSRPAGRTNIGREDASGVIHINSEDEDADMQFDDDIGQDDDDDDDDGRAAAAQAAAFAQEEEDAAMAKRLQEEMYQEDHSSGTGSRGLIGDAVRAPIARTTETLVAPNPSWAGPGGVGGDDAEAAILEQLRQRRQPPRKSGIVPNTTECLGFSF